jgi:asparagine synthase (glutamine-hydrolysing)
MSGICAVLFPGAVVDDDDRCVVHAMSQLQSHRGPDFVWITDGPSFVLGNSLLQTGPNATEKLPDMQQIHITYDGHITNRNQLQQQFFSSSTIKSDEELIVLLYQKMGMDFLVHLSGQFAFVLVDQRLNKCWVVRDHFGMRPLFWAQCGNRFYVASEIKALLEVPGLERTLDRESIYHYFTLAYIPRGMTPFKQIHELPGSQLIEIDLNSGQHSQQQYYKIQYDPDPTLSERDLIEPLKQAIIDSVQRNLPASGPVGLMFSGGFDTSSILGIIKTLPQVEQLYTYSVLMQEPSFDESKFQDAMAVPNRNRHHQILVGPREVEDALFKHLAYLDEPSGDGATIPFFLLARQAAKDVRVLISGEGGDETFNAPETHSANWARRHYRRLVPKPVRDAAHWTAHALPCNYKKLSLEFVAKRFTEGAEMGVPESHIHWRHVLPEHDKLLLMPDSQDFASTASIFRNMYDALPFEDELNRLSVIDIRQYFEGDLMVKNDRMLMAHSIQPNLPFMDRILLESVLKIPVNLRLSGLKRRRLQKLALREFVPSRIYKRPNMGLEMPHSIWFLGPLRSLAESLLAPDKVANLGILDPAFVTKLWDDHVNKRRDNGRALWSILILVAWFDLFVASDRYKDELGRRF